MARSVWMKWLIGVWAIALLFGFSTPIALAETASNAATHQMTVYRSENCSCCGKWIDHVQAAGFEIDDHFIDDMDAKKAELGVPEAASSCHTAVVDGYLVEGHVPVADLQRLLAERSAVVGIAVPGMPMGSPGMESDDGEPSDPFSVVTFTEDGTVNVFQEYPEGV